MNKTIEILSDDTHILPKGTKVKSWVNGALEENVTLSVDTAHCTYNNHTQHIEVDFSELPPIYPTKGMEVPEEGIEFTDGSGKLYFVSEFGIAYIEGEYDDTDSENDQIVKWEHASYDGDYELKRTLPKTITVCADCFKETCECKHAKGWYRVKVDSFSEWRLRYWDQKYFRDYKNGSIQADESSYEKIDWKNKVNVTPESI